MCPYEILMATLAKATRQGNLLKPIFDTFNHYYVPFFVGEERERDFGGILLICAGKKRKEGVKRGIIPQGRQFTLSTLSINSQAALIMILCDSHAH